MTKNVGSHLDDTVYQKSNHEPYLTPPPLLPPYPQKGKPLIHVPFRGKFTFSLLFETKKFGQLDPTVAACLAQVQVVLPYSVCNQFRHKPKKKSLKRIFTELNIFYKRLQSTN